MHIASPVHFLALVPLVFSTQLMAADIFKCTTADGKTSYSASPCAAEGAKEVVVPIVPPPPASPGKVRDWADENAAGNARVKAAPASAAAAENAQKASAPSKSAQQTVAECEANRGVDCNSAEEIARRQSDDRTLTEEEAAALHRASAGRRENERKKALPNPPKPK